MIFGPYLKNGEEKGDFWKKKQICEYNLAEPSRTFASGGTATLRCLNVLSGQICEYILTEHNSQTKFRQLCYVVLRDRTSSTDLRIKSASTYQQTQLAVQHQTQLLPLDCETSLADPNGDFISARTCSHISERSRRFQI